MVRLDGIRPGVWDATVEVMESALRDLEFDGDDIVYNWRKDANLKRRERELFEKYGFLKDIILNPTFQDWKQWFDELWDHHTPSMEFTLGEPMMPLVTCIVVMFLMHKRVPNDFVVLAGGLLFNVNPIYVVLGTIAYHLASKWFRPKPRQYVKITPAKAKDGDDVAVPYSDSQLCKDGSDNQKDGVASNLFDHVLIGGDVSTLFTAALLSKVGHRCCVLQPDSESPTSIRPAEAPCTIPLTNLTVGKPERYQALLDLVQEGLTDKERVYFAPVGHPSEGYAYSLMRGLLQGGAGANQAALGARSPNWKKPVGGSVSLRDLWCLRPSITGFVGDLASRYLVDSSALVEFFGKVAMQQQYVTSFLLNKTFPASVQQPPAGQSSGLTKGDADTAFESVSCRSVAEILAGTGLEPGSPESQVVLGAALASVDEQGVSSHDCSGNSLAQALATMESGLFYPRGGSVALERMMTAVVQRAGGLVVSRVPVKEVVMEPKPQGPSGMERADKAALSAYVADRVALDDGRDVYANKAIISGMGIIGTYSSLLFGHESDKIDPRDLAAMKKRVFGTTLADLQEHRPVQRAVFCLSAAPEGGDGDEDADTDAETESGEDTPGSGGGGGASSSSGGCTNYKSLPGAVDYVEFQADARPAAIAATEAEGARDPSLRVWSPSARDPSWKARYPDIQVVVMEYECSEPYVTRRKVTGSGIPKDSADAQARGPTVFIRRSEDIYMTEQYRAEFLRHAQKKLHQLYPALASDNRIIHSQVVLPSRLEGKRCANTVSKYAKPVSACSDLQGLYFCGRDVATSGLSADLQGAFVAANAVLGYTVEDKKNMRNVISDLKNI